MTDWLMPFAAPRRRRQWRPHRPAAREMLTLLYAPTGRDPQTSHRQDEIYIV